MTFLKRADKATSTERRRASIKALPSVGLAMLILGGIYSGAFTPTEAAAIGFAASVVTGAVILRSLDWAGFHSVVKDSMVTTVAMLLIIAGVKIFGKAIAPYRVAFHRSHNPPLLSRSFFSDYRFVARQAERLARLAATAAALPGCSL